MKAVLLFGIAFAIIIASNALDKSDFSEEDKQWFDNIHQTCVEESEVDEDKASKRELTHHDYEFKDYAKCVLKKSGAMNKRGRVDFAPIAEHVPEDYLSSLEYKFEQCPNIRDERCPQMAYDVFSEDDVNDLDFYFGS